MGMYVYRLLLAIRPQILYLTACFGEKLKTMVYFIFHWVYLLLGALGCSAQVIPV